jgi:hypothetical protein
MSGSKKVKSTFDLYHGKVSTKKQIGQKKNEIDRNRLELERATKRKQKRIRKPGNQKQPIVDYSLKIEGMRAKRSMERAPEHIRRGRIQVEPASPCERDIWEQNRRERLYGTQNDGIEEKRSKLIKMQLIGTERKKRKIEDMLGEE